MPFTPGCVRCLLDRQMALVPSVPRQHVSEYIRGVLRLLAEAPDDVCIPWLLSRLERLYSSYTGVEDRYAAEKDESNRMVLSFLDVVCEAIAAAPDPVQAGLRYARVGNYIDYSALKGSVSREEFTRLVESAAASPVDEDTYRQFTAELQKAKKLLYLHDNAGEIVFDMLLIRELKKAYPELQIVSVVRGAPAANDATMHDAVQIGLTELVSVITNGGDIPGTYPPEAGEELLRELAEADVILSKGQGNYETLCGSGYNVFYLYLVKCEFFMELTGLEKFSGVFSREPKKVDNGASL